MNKGFFLDRDGIVNEVKVVDGITRPPDTLEEFRFKDGIEQLCTFLHDVGFHLIVVTNQPDVARGRQTEENVEAIHSYIRKTIPVKDILVCYHDDSDQCECRKPKPGMLLKAARRHDLVLSESFILGDRWSDVLAGKAAGCRTILYENLYSGAAKCSPDYSVKSFDEIKLILLSDSAKK